MSVLVLVKLAALAGATLASALPTEVVDNGTVTVAEVRANAARTFAAFAGEGARSVTKAQFVATDLSPKITPATPDKEILATLFDRLDANGNGRLTRNEWQEGIERDLAFADQNEDGRITLTELANAKENMSIGDALGMVF